MTGATNNNHARTIVLNQNYSLVNLDDLQTFGLIKSSCRTSPCPGCSHLSQSSSLHPSPSFLSPREYYSIKVLDAVAGTTLGPWRLNETGVWHLSSCPFDLHALTLWSTSPTSFNSNSNILSFWKLPHPPGAPISLHFSLATQLASRFSLMTLSHVFT